MAPELPTGTVTFLFTDVEGSTRLLQELGTVAYADVLSDHRRVLRQAFVRYGGVEVDTQGEAFFVAFSTAPAALAAAAEVQQVLAEGPIRVRLGIHTGTPQLTDEGYVGLDVHRAARIAAAGHGGQVLVSASTASLVEVGSLRDLGEHRLKDLAAAERIYQFGDEAFPPLKSLQQTNLPIPVTPFLGRDRELDEVTGLLESGGTRLLTLTGPAGAGKTRLALQAAAEASDEYPDGVFWVPLGALRDPELILEVAAQALEIRDGLAGYISDRRLLLILDNFEHLMDAAGELGGLVAACPKLQLLVTSRELLRLPGEQAYPVGPLEPQEAIRLFTARARAADPRFQADPTVEQLCARLDNLPLALELAATRVTVLSAEQLLDRLSARLALLKAGRGVDPRQRTLRATIEWSHDLLDEHEQMLFRRLAVFAGGCTLEAAEKVADAELDILQSLIEKSLVRFNGRRYSMLETIREFAAERLAAAHEEDLYRGRLLEGSLELLRSLRPDSLSLGRIDVNRIGVEEDNVRVSLEYALQSGRAREWLELVPLLGDFWMHRGGLQEGLAWTERIEAATRETPLTEEKVLVTLWLGEFLRFLGRPREAIPWKERALEQSRELGLDTRAAAALHDLADIFVQLGDLRRARELSHEALEIREREGESRGIAHALSTIAEVALLEGNFDEALAVCDRIDSLLPDDDSEDWRVLEFRRVLELTRAEVYRRCGDERRAAESLGAAAEKALRTEGSRLGVAEVLLLAADLVRARAPETAAQLVASARRVRRETGYTVWPTIEYERIAGSVEAEHAEELAVDDALRLALDCLG